MAPFAHGPAAVSKRRVAAWLGAVLALLAVAALIAFDPLVRWYTVREAARHGIVLSLGRVRPGWDAVVIEHFRFALAGVDGVEAAVARMQVDLDGTRPLRVDLEGVRLAADGSASALVLALTSWAKEHPELLSLPASARDVGVVWRPDGRSAWLTIEGADIAPSSDGGRFEARRVAVVGLEVGVVGASWRGDDARIDVGLGRPDLSAAPLRIELSHALDIPEARIVLSPQPLRALAGPLAIALPIDGVGVSAEAALRWQAPGIDAPIAGQLSATLSGYRPPVPVEVQGLVFGDSTVLDTALEIDAARENVVLRDTKVTHGGVVLEGSGHIRRHPSHAVATLSLAGALPCSVIAEAAVRARIPGIAGNVAGSIAGYTIAGSVGVKLAIEADTRDLAAAKMDRTIGIGCGLRPGLIPPLPKIDLPKVELPKVELPKIELP